MKIMFFSILVPTMGTRESELRRLFESLNEQLFRDFEVVVVTQLHHEFVESLAQQWSSSFKVKHVKLEKAGLSYARNQGLAVCEGEWVVLSDDDAWYPKTAFEQIHSLCVDRKDIVLTQIYDPVSMKLYKDYRSESTSKLRKFFMMSRSSIEIAYNRKNISVTFDENFGLGAKYPCGEEVDFLLRAWKRGNAMYAPIITVYHQKKSGAPSEIQQYAKGALYAKNFSRFIAMIITIRDKLKHRNTKEYWRGYRDYKKRN